MGQAVSILSETNPTGTKYSDPFDGTTLTGVHLETTGTLSGAVTIWRTCKPAPVTSSDADWVQLTTVSLTQPAGAAMKDLVDLEADGSYLVRLKYVHSSGTGNLLAWANKGGN